MQSRANRSEKKEKMNGLSYRNSLLNRVRFIRTEGFGSYKLILYHVSQLMSATYSLLPYPFPHPLYQTEHKRKECRKGAGKEERAKTTQNFTYSPDTNNPAPDTS